MATQTGTPIPEQQVLAANAAFYEALQALSLEKMDAVWLHEDWVKCVHPGGELVLGWDDVRENWANIFESTEYMRIAVSRPLVRVLGEVAWVSRMENVTSTVERDFATALVEATNLFVLREGRWLMVHHHAAPIPGRLPSGTSRTVQ